MMWAQGKVTLACLVTLLAATTGCTPILVWYGHSADRVHRVEVVEDFGRQSVRVDGHSQHSYAAIAIETVSLSDDGAHLAYAARSAEGWHAVLDGQRGPAHQGIGMLQLVGDRLSYAARDGGQWRVYDRGRAGPPYDAILDGTLRLSDNGVQLAYVAQRRHRFTVVIDQAAGKSYDGIAELTLSGARVAYIARTGTRSRVVIDGVEGPAYDGIGELAVSRFRYAYAALSEPDWVAVVDGAEVGRYDRVDGLRISNHGNVAYVVRRGASHNVVLDGKLSKPYAFVDPRSLRFSPSGRLSYLTRTDGHAHMVVNGEPGPAVDDAKPVVFAASRDRWGYLATRADKTLVVLDGKPSIGYQWAADLMFSANGSRHAYLAQRGPYQMVVHSGGREAFERVVVGTLALDRSGKHWACIVGLRNPHRFFLVVDGKPHKPFDLGEVVAESARLPHYQRIAMAADVNFLRRWVAAELQLMLTKRRLSDDASYPP